MKRKIIIISTILFLLLISCNQENNSPKKSIESVDSISKINTEKSEIDSLDDIFKEFAPIQGSWIIYYYKPPFWSLKKGKLDSNQLLKINKNNLIKFKNEKIIDSTILICDSSDFRIYYRWENEGSRYIRYYEEDDVIVFNTKAEDGAIEYYKRINDSLIINNSKVIENKKSIDSLNFPTEYDYKDAYASHYKYYINKAFSKEIFNKYYKEYQSKKLDSLIKVYEKNKTNTLN